MELSEKCRTCCPVVNNTQVVIEQYAQPQQPDSAVLVRDSERPRLISQGEVFLGKLAASCVNGPFSFRATRADTTYVATVCTSSEMPSKHVQGESYEPITLKRERA